MIVTVSFVSLTDVKVVEVMDEMTLRSSLTVAQKDILHLTQVSCPPIEGEVGGWKKGSKEGKGVRWG